MKTIKHSESDSHLAEKNRAHMMANDAWLEVKPFLTGTHFGVDQATVQIATFTTMVNSLPCGPGALVLDIGAGCCWLSDWLQKLRFQTCSLDLAEELLRIGRKRLRSASFLCAADMAVLPFSDQTADAVVCYSALHHVPNWPAVLREIYRVLRPGGVLVLNEPGRGHHRKPDSITQVERFGVLEQELPARMLARACRQAGFSRSIIRPVPMTIGGRSRVLPATPLRRHSIGLFFKKRLFRFVATIVERSYNLITPLHVVIALKGLACPDSRRPDMLRANFREVEGPRRLTVGRPGRLRTRILNNGLTRWLVAPDSSLPGQVRLGISIVTATGRITDLDFLRLELPHDVAPGSEVVVQGDIPAFHEQGVVHLRLDMVAERIAWFVEHGSEPYYYDLEVKSEP